MRCTKLAMRAMIRRAIVLSVLALRRPDPACRAGDHRRSGGRAGEGRRHRHRHPGAHRSRSHGVCDRARADRDAAARRVERGGDSRAAQERPRRRGTGGARRRGVQRRVDRVRATDRAADSSSSATGRIVRTRPMSTASTRVAPVSTFVGAVVSTDRRSATARRRSGRAAGRARSSEPRALCYAQVSTARHVQIRRAFVTECPADNAAARGQVDFGLRSGDEYHPQHCPRSDETALRCSLLSSLGPVSQAQNARGRKPPPRRSTRNTRS